MLKDRKELEQNLTEAIIAHKLKTNKKDIKDIKKYLSDVHQFRPGAIQAIINDPKSEIPQVDPRVLYLITEQVYSKTGDSNIIPSDYYTENEIKKSRQYTALLDREEDIEFPLTIENVTMFDTNAFFFPMPNWLLAKLSASRKINYNFDIQREAIKRVQHGEVIREAKLYMKNVNEIKENMKNDEQEFTNIVVNAAVRTSNEGDELKYDPIKRTLTITSGSRIDIVDGYHRTKATEMAVLEKPEIKDNVVYGCWIFNYSDDRAAKFQGQLAKGVPLSKERQEYLGSSSNTDLVIKELKLSSELKDRISDTNVIKPTVKEIVSYRVLKDAISEQFKLPKMRDVHDVTDYLKSYFDFLFGYFSDEFISNVSEVNKFSIINSNNIFYGYIVLGRRMFEAGINPRQVKKYISEIDFSRSNPLWEELGILENGTFSDTKKSRTAIRKFFEEIELEIRV